MNHLEHSFTHGPQIEASPQIKNNVSKKLGNHLYCKSLLASFSYDQYMSAVKALQSVFCQNHNKVNYNSNLLILFWMILKSKQKNKNSP